MIDRWLVGLVLAAGVALGCGSDASNGGAGNTAGSGGSVASAGEPDCGTFCAAAAMCPDFPAQECNAICPTLSAACKQCVTTSGCADPACDGPCSSGAPAGAGGNDGGECNAADCEQACIDGLVCRQQYQDQFPMTRNACVTSCMELCGNGFFDDTDSALMNCFHAATDGACFNDQYTTCCAEHFTSEFCD